MVSGKIGGSRGLWLLTDQQLFFAQGLHGGTPGNVKLLNISDELELDIAGDSYMASKFGYSLYLISAFNVSYLDCSLARSVGNPFFGHLAM